jgi:hypothetical protein
MVSSSVEALCRKNTINKLQRKDRKRMQKRKQYSRDQIYLLTMACIWTG